MWIVWLFVGFVLGVVVGFLFAAYACVETNKKAVADGVIKLCGKLFALKEIDV